MTATRRICALGGCAFAIVIPPATRMQQTLSRLLTRPIEVYPDADGWRFKLWASFAKLGGEHADIAIERAVGDVWCPRGDSNTRHAV